MRYHPLGHAMALAEVDGLRLLFDPLLDDVHHGGVFEVTPRRELDVDALRPDFILVSHRHPDHFDLASLRRLAARDDETVVLTPDPLVARAAARLGFRTVRVVAPSTCVELDTVRLVTTPSRANERPLHPDALEWGVALAGDGAVVWNQIDTVHRSTADLLATVDAFEASLDARLALAVVPWCPLLEVEASLAGRLGFPFRAYAELIDRAGALAERGAVIVPGSAGARHRAPYVAMNALVYPVEEARFVRDITARGATAFDASVGASFDVDRSGVHRQHGALVRVLPTPPTDFRPLAVPELVDFNVANRSERDMRSLIERWIRDRLAPTLERPFCYLLEVVYPTDRQTFTLGAAREWDVRNEVAASLLCDVIEGRRHWGDLLLAGALRACSRAYVVGPGGLTRANAPLIFLYQALSYAESVERAVEHELTGRTA